LKTNKKIKIILTGIILILSSKAYSEHYYKIYESQGKNSFVVERNVNSSNNSSNNNSAEAEAEAFTEWVDFANNECGYDFSDINELQTEATISGISCSGSNIEELPPGTGLPNETDSLSLYANNISNLTGLSNLTSVNYLDLETNPLVSLQGLNNLETVGTFYISELLITSLSGLDNLRESTDYIYIEDNNNLVTLDGFNIEIVDYLYVEDNPNLQDISTLNSITIADYISFDNDSFTGRLSETSYLCQNFHEVITYVGSNNTVQPYEIICEGNPPPLCISKEELRTMIVNNEDYSQICTSNITSMLGLFSGRRTNYDVNYDISGWDVSNVENMNDMFKGSSFNVDSDISSWDVSNVQNMDSMFEDASFNGDISGWDVSNVQSMNSMFESSNFNGDISNWNVSSVQNFQDMFHSTNFNGDIANWDVSSATTMLSMFIYASNFNQDLSGWNTLNVTNMNSMLLGTAMTFDISGWNVTNVDLFADFANSSPLEGTDLIPLKFR
jgi:surface protein